MSAGSSLKNHFLSHTSVPVRYGTALAIALVSVFLQYLLLRPHVETLLFPAIFFVAWIAGFGPALLAISLCTTLGLVMAFYGPLFYSNIWHFIAHTVLFVGVNIFASWMIARNRYFEKGLQLERDRLDRALSASAIGFFEWDIDQDQLTLSEQSRLDFGLLPQEVLNMEKILSLIHPDDRERARREIAQAEREGKTYHTEYRVRRPRDGEIVWIEAKGRVRLSGDGTASRRFVGTTLNITGRKLIEQALETKRAEFEAIANNIPLLAWMADSAGDIFWYNKNWYEYTGSTYEEMEGWGWERVHDARELPRVLERWKRALATGEAWEDTFPIRSRSGEFRWHLSRARPIRDGSGRIVRWFGCNIDVHEQRTTQEELQRTEASLREAVRARDEFLSIASHELKTPLTSIKLQGQLLKRAIDTKDPSAYSQERINRLSDQLNKQLQRIGRLVDDMLDVSRIRTGQLTVERERFDLCELVGDLVARMAGQFGSSGVGIRIVRCDEAAGDWDKVRIEQVVTNLITNAIRYGKGRPVTIKVEGMQESVRLSVRDEGIGIARSSHERIFQRFERGDLHFETAGLGLGLFIAKQIVTAHGGKIWVESEPGKGSTFYVELPRHAAKVEGVDVA